MNKNTRVVHLSLISVYVLVSTLFMYKDVVTDTEKTRQTKKVRVFISTNLQNTTQKYTANLFHP